MNNTGQPPIDLGDRTTPSPTSNKSNDSSNSEPSPRLKNKLLSNEMRSIKNRAFHDGYDEGKRATIQKSFDTSYEKAFEQNFILSTLKGVANALKSSHNLKLEQQNRHEDPHRRQTNQRPSSANYSTVSSRANLINNSSTPSACGTDSIASSSPKSASLLSSASSTSSSPSSSSSPSDSQSKHRKHRGSNSSSSKLLTQKYHNSSHTNSGRRSVTSNTSSVTDRHSGDYSARGISSMSSGNVSNYGGNFSSTSVVNVNISSNHMSLLESMKFDGASDIESLKRDLIRICRENRLEILAHYVSQIG